LFGVVVVVVVLCGGGGGGMEVVEVKVVQKN
jgi:hypothetical protein